MTTTARLVLSVLQEAQADYWRRGEGGFVGAGQIGYDAAEAGLTDNATWTGLQELVQIGVIEGRGWWGGSAAAYRIRRRWYAPGGVVRRRDPHDPNNYARAPR